MFEYPVKFIVEGSWLNWSVYSIYPDGIKRVSSGPYLRKVTASRIADSLTQHYRNGWDMKGIYET